MKHLKLFNDAASYEAWKNSEEYVLPNVTFIEDGNLHYNAYVEPVVASPNIVAVYNVTDISWETNIIGSYGIGNVESLIIDGNEVEPDTYYQFENTGLHTVEIILEDKTNMANMFYDSDELVSFTIPDSITEIDPSICYGCKNLTNVSIGSGVTSYIGYNIFNPNVTITISKNNPVYDNRENCNCIIETATNTLIEGFNNSFIPDSVTTIGNSAFENCSGLTSITIPNSVTTIGNSAFSYCKGLTSVEIPNSVTTIINYAFSHCTSLTSITIPDSVTSIKHRAFDSCSSLTSINIPNSVTEIDSYVFSDCTNLSSVTIGSGVKTIGAGAFYFCSSLVSIEIPDSVTTIGENAFYYCRALTSVTLGDSVASIGDDAFYKAGLTSIELPASLTSIGESPFNCPSLTSITCYATTEPSVSKSGYGICDTSVKNGVLRIPSGSYYSQWMYSQQGVYKGLSYYGWKVEYI